ncbi:PucR family transcriptional regulator [Nocardioides insulae]|uniref:PucR family transcriptional regulator n=1 Tax=Nocardioides insulae TaxID=394734 RepID=UPI0003F5F7CC|nr:helix-turn-helix domain-containing protein [Nocardioides insulae]
MTVTPDAHPHAHGRQRMRLEVERAWAALLEDADAIGDRVSQTLITTDQELYDGAGPAAKAQFQADIREHMQRGLAAMAGLGEPGQEPQHLWREHARRQARIGCPLETMLNGYAVGTRMLWEALLDKVDAREVAVGDRVLVVAGQWLWGHLDLQNSTVIAAYRQESALLARRDLERQGRVLVALVDGRGSDPAFAAEAHDILGVTVDEPIACVAAPFDGSVDYPLRSPEDRLDAAGLASFWHVRGETLFGLVRLGELTGSDLVPLLLPCAHGRVGVAAAVEGLAGFSTAHQLACRAAETVSRDHVDVVNVEDRLPEVLLTAAPAASQLLVREVLGPVLAQAPGHSATLLDTLRALLAHDLSPTHAAEALECHRNTVIYRSRQLQELTGRTLSDARDRMLLGLALIALDL